MAPPAALRPSAGGLRFAAVRADSKRELDTELFFTHSASCALRSAEADRRFLRMIRRALVVLAFVSTALAVLPLSAASAQARGPVGAVAAWQDTGTARLTVSGWAYDARHPGAS